MYDDMGDYVAAALSLACCWAFLAGCRCSTRFGCHALSSVVLVLLCRSNVTAYAIGAILGVCRHRFPFAGGIADSVLACEEAYTRAHCAAASLVLSPGCRDSLGCHACGRIGCWTWCGFSPFYGRHRLRHAGAQARGNIPHMAQVQVNIIPNERGMFKAKNMPMGWRRNLDDR